ncbi:MAG: hypothetical protein K2I18_08530 [Paramuribaculum sp.]|nr:hypothetical protein [Paramuribaculum sp.]
MKEERLMRMSRVSPRVADEMDSVAYERSRGEDRRAFDILMEARVCWDAMAEFRKERERNKRYAYGKQWLDTIEVDGCTITEEEYIARQGNVPLKNNVVRRLVRNVLGVYRSQSKEPTCYARDRDEQQLGETMTGVLQYNMQLNRMNEVLARTMEEFLISGLIVHRKSYGWRNDRLDCWTDYVNPNNFFIDSNMRDFRGWDVTLLGEVHDVSFGDLCSQFAESPADYRRLREIYSAARSVRSLNLCAERFGYSRLRSYDFMMSSDPTRCRVIEVWRKESKARFRCHDYNTGDVFKIDLEDKADLVDRVNEGRLQRGRALGVADADIPLIKTTWMMDNYWSYYYLSPFGHILKEGETPYEHKSHPYVFRAYPFIDGEVHSFIADVIDQQRYINRLITLFDFIMRASAKGALLFPEGALPDGYSMDDIAEEWSRFDGLVVYKPKAGVPAPQQIASNSTNIGITELLNIQLKLMEDISGVNGALQGKPGFSGQSAAMYNQQTQNATTSLLDLLESFSDFVKEGAIKDVKNMQQFYDTKRVFNIVGKNAQIEYDPPRIRDVEFDLSIIESTSTPAYRQQASAFLTQLWSAGAISVEQLLEHGDFPFADELLQSIRSQREQMQQGQIPQGVSPQLMQQVQQGANPQAMSRLQEQLAIRN